VDGIALGTRPLAGNIFGNTNFGQLVEVNLATLDRSSQGCRCALRSDRPKRRAVALRASVGSTEAT
jgi:hypothetical protein